LLSLKCAAVLDFNEENVDDPDIAMGINQYKILIRIELHASPFGSFWQLWDQVLELNSLEALAVRTEEENLVGWRFLTDH